MWRRKWHPADHRNATSNPPSSRCSSQRGLTSGRGRQGSISQRLRGERKTSKHKREGEESSSSPMQLQHQSAHIHVAQSELKRDVKMARPSAVFFFFRQSAETQKFFTMSLQREDVSSRWSPRRLLQHDRPAIRRYPNASARGID